MIQLLGMTNMGIPTNQWKSQRPRAPHVIVNKMTDRRCKNPTGHSNATPDWPECHILERFGRHNFGRHRFHRHNFSAPISGHRGKRRLYVRPLKNRIHWRCSNGIRVYILEKKGKLGVPKNTCTKQVLEFGTCAQTCIRDHFLCATCD